jgi:hypothetical protein
MLASEMDLKANTSIDNLQDISDSDESSETYNMFQTLDRDRV